MRVKVAPLRPIVLSDSCNGMLERSRTPYWNIPWTRCYRWEGSWWEALYWQSLLPNHWRCTWNFTCISPYMLLMFSLGWVSKLQVFSQHQCSLYLALFMKHFLDTYSSERRALSSCGQYIHDRCTLFRKRLFINGFLLEQRDLLFIANSFSLKPVGIIGKGKWRSHWWGLVPIIWL